MIRAGTERVIPELPEIALWNDSEASHIFYFLPIVPRFRMQNGKPVFKLIKYRLPVDRPDGKKGGGYVFFDAELAVPPDQLVKLKEILQAEVNKNHQDLKRPGPAPEVKFGTISFSRGTVNMLLEENGVIVEKVRGAGKPSLFGNNIATFMIELTPEGVQVFEGAMQGEGASMVSLVYDMYFWAKLPPVKATVWFHADKFYSYYQTVETEVSTWSEDSYHETLSEMLRESESGGYKVEGDITDPKLIDKLNDWASRTLDDAVARAAQQAITPLTEEQRKTNQKVLDDLGGDDLDHMSRNITNHKMIDIFYSATQETAVEWNLAPQGNLGTLTSMKGPDGKPLLWKDYSVEIKGDDDFFKQLNVSTQVNADFTNLPLHSVELHIEYPKEGNDKDIAEYRFSKADDVAKFATYIANDNWKYKYWYEVNFKGAARTYKSPVVETDEKILTINVDQTGILSVDLIAGDLDFDQVRAAQVTIKYEDAEHNVPLMQQVFTIDADHTTQRFQKLIFSSQEKPYEYRVKYIMKDGKEFQGDWIKDWSTPLYINDPWSETKQVMIRASGNLSEQIETIFVDLNYSDATNKYSQTKSVALNENEPAAEWLFPVISGSTGKITYSGMIKYRDSTEEPITQQEMDATKTTLIVGPSVREHMTVEILPDLMFDDSDVRLVRVALHYKDDANQVDLRKDFTFRPGMSDAVTWTVDQKDKSKDEYEWQATFFMQGGTQRKTPLATSTELTLVPELGLATA